jgi:hypothetical protein
VASGTSENGEFNSLSQTTLLGCDETRIGSLFDISLSAHCASRQRLLSSHSLVSNETNIVVAPVQHVSSLTAYTWLISPCLTGGVQYQIVQLHNLSLFGRNKRSTVNFGIGWWSVVMYTGIHPDGTQTLTLKRSIWLRPQ